MTDDWLTTAEIAALLKVTAPTVCDMICRHELPGRKIGRTWRVRRRDYEAFCGFKMTPVRKGPSVEECERRAERAIAEVNAPLPGQRPRRRSGRSARPS